MKRLMLIFALMFSATVLLAGEPGRKLERHLFMPKKDWGVGVQFTTLSVGAQDSDLLMVIDGLTGASSMTRFSVQATRAYVDNHAFGLRATYMKTTNSISDITLDLLNEGLQFELKDVMLNTNTFKFAAFHRSWFGLDPKGRVGLFFDLSLSYSLSASDSYILAQNDLKAHKFALGFAPGIEVFILNFMSFDVSIGLAEISNTMTTSNGVSGMGERNVFRAKADLNLADINFGLNFHF